MARFSNFFKQPPNRKGLSLVLIVGGAALFSAWIGGNLLAGKLLEQASRTLGVNSAHLLRNYIGDFESVLQHRALVGEEKLHADIIKEAGKILQYRLFDATGRLIFTSEGATGHDVIPRETIQNYLEKGQDYLVPIITQYIGGKTLEILEVYTPVMKEGRLIGVVELFMDFTTQVHIINLIRRVSISITTVIFIFLGGLTGFLIILNEKAHKQSENEIRRVNQELEEHNRMIKADLRLASEFQQGVLSTLRQTENLKVDIRYLPASEVSGDMYDLSLNREGDLNLFLGDATGHGVSAAFITMMTHVSLDALKSHLPPVAVVEGLNERLGRRELDGKFLTCVFLRISPEGLVKCANAAHPPVIILPSSGGGAVLLDKRGLPLGVFDDSREMYEEDTYQLSTGDKLIVTTDGLTEQRNDTEEFYGVERVISILSRNRMLPPEAMMEALFKDIELFSDGNPPTDDQTIVIVEYTGDGSTVIN